MQLTDWYYTGSFLDINDHKIFYKMNGNGPVLLMIHGFPTSSWDWYQIWPELTQRYKCIAIDMLGFGYSSKPKQDYLIKEQADIIEDALRQIGVSTAHVLSHDYGDTVSQELLARQCDGILSFEIKTLHLLNGGLFPETHHALLVQKLMLSPLGGVFARLLTRKSLEINFKHIFGQYTPPSEQEIKDFWYLIKHNNGKHVMHKILDYVHQRTAHRERWVTALQNTQVPIKLTVGMADPVSGAHMVDRYRELITDPLVTELDDIGHYPQLEAPDVVSEEAIAFIKEN
ncbi:MAG: alpha/beta hydrolase [Pseudomonadota bacterium]